jgi:glycosyltransferase involved in cell wall biosynthesis
VRILHLADRVSDRGGADVHLLGVLAEQARSHTVHCVAGRIEVDPGVPASVLPALAAREPFGDLGALVSEVRRVAPEVIHLHNVMAPAILRWAALEGAVVTVQDHRAFCPGQGKWTLSGARCERTMSPEVCRDCFVDDGYRDAIVDVTAARRDALAMARRVVVLSEYMKRELIQAGLSSDRIQVVPPFVWGLAPRQRSVGESIAVVGRVVRAKGIDDAIEAWRRARVGLPLVFVGTGSERPRIEGLGFRVTGWLDRKALGDALHRASVVVMAPRWQEPFGIAGLEALAMGAPVAAWRSGGIAEWHPAPVEYGDVDALAASLRSLIGTRARSPEGFDPAPLMHRLEAVYAS